MLFNSFEYAFFLILVLILYHAALGRRVQNVLLLAASYWFYAAWDARFLTLIWISTAVDYVVGLRLAATRRSSSDNVRRAWLAVSLATNLGLLGVFKYFGFFVDGFRRSPRRSWPRRVDVDAEHRVTGRHIILQILNTELHHRCVARSFGADTRCRGLRAVRGVLSPTGRRAD